jgi:hypothetical protein
MGRWWAMVGIFFPLSHAPWGSTFWKTWDLLEPPFIDSRRLFVWNTFNVSEEILWAGLLFLF